MICITSDEAAAHINKLDRPAPDHTFPNHLNDKHTQSLIFILFPFHTWRITRKEARSAF